MEKIKAAILKSKKENQAKKPTSSSRTLDQRHQVTPENDVKNIKYQTTKTITLDPVHLESNRIISVDKSDARSIRFDMLRTHILQKMKENNWRTVAVTSPMSGCGKTVISINLSISMAKQTERTVLLADFDLRKPHVGVYLGLPKTTGLIDYMEERIELGDALINPGIPRLTVLANSVSVKNATETLLTSRMSNFVAELRERYESRTILFDLPPLLETDDAMAFIPQVDCVILVVANGSSTSSEVKKSMKLLSGTNIVSVILNKSEESNQSKYTYY